MFGPLGWVGLRGTFSPESLEKAEASKIINNKSIIVDSSQFIFIFL